MNPYKTALFLLCCAGTLLTGGDAGAGIIQVGPSEWIVNADARLAGDYPPSAPRNVYPLSLGPGAWRFTLVTPAMHPSAVYSAWSYTSSGSHWRTSTRITSLTTSVGFDIGIDGNYATAEDAYAATTLRSRDVVLTDADTLYTFFQDQYLGDNRGGASVHVVKLDLEGAISVNASPTTGGTVTGGGTFPVGSQQQISATASTNFLFTGWNDGNTDNPRTISVPSGGATHTAIFARQMAAIAVNASPTTGGTVSPASGSFPVGSPLLISAAASTCYQFTGWSVNGVNDGNTDMSRTITVPPGGATYTANFHNILKNSVDAVVDANGITITATFKPKDAQGNAVPLPEAARICRVNHFNWIQHVTSVPTHWTVTSHVSGLTVELKPPNILDPIASSNPSDYYEVRSSLLWTEPPMQFLHDKTVWDNGQARLVGLDTFDNHMYYLNEPGIYDARYDTTDKQMFVDTPAMNWRYFPFDLGSVQFETKLVGVYDDPDTTPAGWNNLGTNFQWESNTRIKDRSIVGGVSVEGYFRLMDPSILPEVISGGVSDVAVDAQFSITPTTSPRNGGVVAGNGVYIGGTNATLTANSNSGFAFTNWTENDAVVSTSSSYSFFVNSTRSLVANFQPNSWSSWQSSNFAPEQLADMAISGDAASPANDGVANLLKYAFGMNPNTNSRTGLPIGGRAMVNGTDCLTLIYRANDVATDISYHPEWSADLSAWSNTGLTEQGLSDDGAIKQIRAAVPLNSAPKLFMRLRITRP